MVTVVLKLTDTKLESSEDFSLNYGKGFKLNFSKQISNVCKREHNQIQVIKRFRHILSDSTKARLYKAFIMPRTVVLSDISVLPEFGKIITPR